jgi:hypothetical protein
MLFHFSQRAEIENQLQKTKFEKMDVENNLRAKIDSLESQILSLEEAKEHEKNNSVIKIVSHYTNLLNPQHSFLVMKFQISMRSFKVL